MTLICKPLITTLAGAWLLALPGAAFAGEWTGPNGGTVSRSATVDGRLYSGSVTATGPNGAAVSTSTTCFDGIVDRCARSTAGVTAGGDVYTGSRAVARGPHGNVRSVRAITGPEGNTVYGVRRIRR